MTIKGKRLIDHADVLIYAGSLVNPEVLADRKPESVVYDSAGMTLEEVLAVMKQAEQAGKTTVRVHTGDASIYGAIREQLDALDRMGIAHEVVPGVSSFLAAAAALNEENGEVDAMVREYRRRRDYAVKAINEIPGISCLCPKGAFYIFINVKQLGKTSEELAQYLLEKAKIALVPGNVFGPGGEGYLRMSFAASYEDIVEGCQKLKQAITGKEI